MPCLLIRPNLLGLYESFIKIRLLYDGFSVIMTGSVAKITDGVISEAKKKRSSMVDETDFRKAVELINSSTEVLLTPSSSSTQTATSNSPISTSG